MDGGGPLVCSAIRSNTLLQQVDLTGACPDKAFCDGLIFSLARNHSVTHVDIGKAYEPPLSDDDKYDVEELIKSVACHNESIESMIFLENTCKLSVKARRELYQDLKQNYSLKYIRFGNEFLFETILKLNRAGRRYLKEDATSRSKCIAVLAKVKDDLSCLFVHLRENPLICKSDDNGRFQVTGPKGTKRRVDGTVE